MSRPAHTYHRLFSHPLLHATTALWTEKSQQMMRAKKKMPHVATARYSARKMFLFMAKCNFVSHSSRWIFMKTNRLSKTPRVCTFQFCTEAWIKHNFCYHLLTVWSGFFTLACFVLAIVNYSSSLLRVHSLTSARVCVFVSKISFSTACCAINMTLFNVLTQIYWCLGPILFIFVLGERSTRRRSLLVEKLF